MHKITAYSSILFSARYKQNIKWSVFSLLGIDFLFIPPRFLIEKGIDVSIKDDDGNTALHIALKEAIKTRSSSEVNEGIDNSEFSHVIYPCSFVHQCITRPMLLLLFFF